MRATSGFPSIYRTIFHTCCNYKDIRFYSCASHFLSSATVRRGWVGYFGTSTNWSVTSSLKLNNLFRHRTNAQYFRTCSVLSKTMNLSEVLGGLEKFAPTSLAEGWDNVGLLVEPTPPHQVQTVFLTNDLTEEVLSEAIQEKADFILSYHPPIFSALKRLTMASTKERIIVKAIEKRIAVFSPHTCYDAVQGGVNDWLAEGLGIIYKCNLVHKKCNLSPATTFRSYYLPSTRRLAVNSPSTHFRAVNSLNGAWKC